MLLLGVFATLLISASAQFCYNDVESACDPKTNFPNEPGIPNCNARYGAIENLQVDLQAYANYHIKKSFEFLLLSTHFGNYETNRNGFRGLYRKLSDSAWEKSIDIMKYISQRGGRMTFNQLPHLKKTENQDAPAVFELNELPSLAKALDWQKQLAKEALRLHMSAMEHKDPAIAHYLEEEFMEPQSEVIRTLAGHTSDLKSMLKTNGALATFLFDEYLQKTL